MTRHHLKTGYRTVLTLLTVGVVVWSQPTAAEWDGVLSSDYWWPYNLYLALIWIGLPLYIFAGWLHRWRRDRKALKGHSRDA